MPRRRKIGGSPSRKTGAAAFLPQGDPSLSMSQPAYSVNKEKLFNSMSEMFSDLDPSVVYMVLSECDFKENAMDCLLELSTHAEGAASSKVSDFESVASSLALVNQRRSVPNQRIWESTVKHCNSEEEEEEEKVLSPDMPLTEELDSLIENAFQRCSLSVELPNSANDQIVCEHDGFKEFPEWEESDLGCNVLLFPHQIATSNEVLENCSSQLPANQLNIQTSSPAASDTFAQALEDSDLSKICVHQDIASEAYKQSNGETSRGNSDQAQHIVSDHKSATTASGESSQRALELGVAITEEPNSQCLQQHRELMTACDTHNTSLPEACVSLEKSSFKTPKLKDFQQSEQNYSFHLSTPSCRTQQQWNLMAPAFYPSIGSHSFVTPVAVSPGQWRPVSDYRTLEKGLAFSSPVVPNAWDSSPSLKVWENQDRNSKLNLSQAQQPPVCHMMRKKMHLIGQVLVLLRGVPGSGKSYLARMILEDNPGGVILSTDDYFYKCGKYHYDARCLGEAHEWNRKRAKEAFEMKISPIIIDNTNIQAWEMKPYVALAQQFKYKVMFREPDTWWKFKPKELERRNIHGVSKEKIKRMLEQYERCLTVNSILESSVPEKSEVTAWNEDPCQEESHREREAHSQKENKPFASDLEPLNLPEDDKPLSSCSLISESNFAPESYQKEEKEMENNSVKHSTENNTIQDILDVDLSSYVEKELPLEKKEEKGERMEITETEMDETDIITTEETVCLHRGGVEKHSNDNILKVQTESERNSEVGLESDSTERSNVVEPSVSVMEASEKPELLNFLGDWPVQQTMGQRVKRTRRLEKSSLKSDREGKTPSQHPELGKEQAGLTDTCTVVKGQEGENTTSSCFSATSDKVAPDLQIVGHWPVSLEQRQQRSRRMRKTSLSQSDEGRNTEGDVNRSALDTVDVLRGIPMDTVEQDVEELHFHQPEMIGNETVAKKKTQQNKRTRKHHKLALTFTNNNLPHSKEEEQLSVPDSAEEKQDACSCKQISSHSQTESHDFALLWRLENKMLFPETVKVLHGRLDGFKPKDMDNASGSQEKIPYRVMYDKSTFVEESELIDIDETEKLNMLCKLFDSFSVEAVKDLYERCNKDINWATGLLLDSDEKLHNDVNTEWFQVKEAEPVVADFDFKENTSYDENRDSCTNTEQIIGASNVSDPSEDQNSSISTEESRVTKTVVADAGVSDSFTAVILNDSVELKNSSDTAPRGYAGSSAASVNESISGMQKMESESPVEEVVNKLSVSQVDVDLYVPVTLSQALKTTTNSKLTNESDSNSSEGNVENAKGMPLLLDVDDAPLIDSRNDKELETDRENPGSSREISGKEESRTLSRNEDKAKTQSPSPVSSAAFDIDSLELTLPPELALQLKEIFGPVGIDAGSLTAEDCVVHIDLNLAKVIHEKWKESILKRQRRDESWKLSAEGSTLIQQINMNDSKMLLSQNAENKMQKKGMNWVSSSSNETQIKKAATSEVFPFMDHWNARTQKVSLRQIISEEIAMQEKEDLKRVPSVARKDCAAKLKEKQLFEMFPTINQNFLMDIFKDNNYSLEQTEQFLNCVLEADPVKTVIAQESVQRNEIASSYSAAKNREKARKAKEEDDVLSEIFQEYEYPQYDDFRAEAFHHQQKRQECLKKAGEAYHMGMKPVAAFYARQGRLHEQKMKEANHAAAARIFERVNTSLLPLNVLDLHGLHVDEAVNQLSRVLQEKSNEYQQSGGKPYLCVITGRGSHSQGGVARIKPAAIRYLTSHNFRFAEIKPGCLKVMLN
ncbi:NEDD4-binding protein 2 isoform X2 [Centrocercus urophasianus]|uniref:NEDD4-binding protein 2 isoform X2 n=1 Tax=Centrocercus urophasianus TaxID=9002 RepID=UPI001C64D0F7|nr:NEDD4-binding protein 2 isoform X2 [Centrocercus urophasianus]